MTSAYYSKLLGMDENYLNVYRVMRGYKKRSTTAKEMYIQYKLELEEENMIKEKMQKMYYDLKTSRKLMAFSQILINMKLYTKHQCFMYLVDGCFSSDTKLKGKVLRDKMNLILSLFEKFKKDGYENT
ncbi:MAG: hypothetical protein EOM05_09815 [Clostridia bacterium]|nr:hypothetical protein [Clostridia bacterium]